MQEVSITLKDIIVLLTLALTVGAPVIKLNTSIVKLSTKMDTISGDLTSLSTENAKTHSRIFTQIDKHEEKLNDHDKRITVLEHDIKK